MNQSVVDFTCKLRLPPWAATAGDIPVRPELALNPAMPFFRSSARGLYRANTGYRKVNLQGNIEVQFLHATLTGSEIFPFAHFRLCNCRLLPKKAPITFSRLILAFYQKSLPLWVS